MVLYMARAYRPKLAGCPVWRDGKNPANASK